LFVFVWLASVCGLRCVVGGGHGPVELLLGGLDPICIGFRLVSL
jgi:hypothetical protein